LILQFDHAFALLYTLLQIFSVSVFEKIELQRAFAQLEDKTTVDADFKSLPLFDL